MKRHLSIREIACLTDVRHSVVVEIRFLDYFSISMAGLINLNDGSVGFVPELCGEPHGNLEIGVGAMLFFGPEASELDGEYSGSFDATEPAVYSRCKLSF